MLVNDIQFKDRLILVFYIGVRNIDNSDIASYISEIADYFSKGKDNTVEMYFILDPENRTSRVECINPMFLTEEKIKETEEKTNELMTRLSQTVNRMIENG